MNTSKKPGVMTIASMSIEDAMQMVKEVWPEEVTFWLPTKGMCGPMPRETAVKFIHKHFKI